MNVLLIGGAVAASVTLAVLVAALVKSVCRTATVFLDHY